MTLNVQIGNGKARQVKSAPGSFIVGPTGISSSIQGLELRLPGGRDALILQNEYDANGSKSLTYFKLGERNPLEVNTEQGQVIESPIPVTYTTAGDNLTYDFDIVPAQEGNLRVIFWEGTEEGDIDDAIFDETLNITNEDVNNIVTFNLGNKYLLYSGTQLFVKFEGVNLKGGIVPPGSPFEGQLLPYFVSRIQPFTLVGILDAETLASELKADGTNIANVPDETNVQDIINSLQGQITSNRQAQAIARGSFDTFNDSFNINETNAVINGGRVNIYAAKIDKNVTVRLPTTAELATAGVSYPYGIEFVHSAGTSRSLTTNRLMIDAGSSGQGDLIDTISDGINRSRFTLFQDDIALFVKDDANSNYRVLIGAFDPIAEITRQGVFAFRNDIVISKIDDLETELAGITINQGDALSVTTGGTRFGQNIADNSVIIAKQNNPDTGVNSDDWLVFSGVSNGLNADQMAFFGNIERDGTRFDASRNFFVNESNVIIKQNIATGTGVGASLPVSIASQVQTQQTIDLGTQNIQFSDLVGGNLALGLQFQQSSSQGFEPEPQILRLTYGSTVFDFPINTVSMVDGNRVINITIPNEDYSSILNTDAKVELIVNFRGISYVGVMTIQMLINSLKGTLYDGVNSLANMASANVEMRLEQEINALKGEVNEGDDNLEAIIPRVSPYKNITTFIPDINARFLDSTGSDNPPTNIANMNQVSADNPRFEGGNIALYVAVVALNNTTYALKNITKSTVTNLDNSEPNVTVLESLTYQGNTYFVYRVTGLTATEVYEVDRVELNQVVAWASDIDNLEADVDRIDAELDTALLNLPQELVQVLEHDVTVTEESSPTISASAYNIGLGAGTSQKVFYETSPNTPSGGVLNSKPLKENTGDRDGRKLCYLLPPTTYSNQAYLTAFDGVSTGTELIRYENGTFNAKVFVPAKSAGSSTETIYPAPQNRVSGAGIWQNIPALTFINGIPVAEADELFFDRNIPSQSITLNIAYRGHANGNVFGVNSATLVGVGGASDVSTTFTLNDGSETAIVEVLWRASQRDIRVSVTERVNTGLPTINDIEVILSYAETRTIPATPATTRDVPIGNITDGAKVFGIKPSDTGNLILASDTREIDTGYAYTTLFGASEDGYLILGSEDAVFLDYEDFDLISTNLLDIQNHALLPQYGLFTTNYTHESIVNLGTQLRIQSESGNEINLSERKQDTKIVEIDPNGVQTNSQIPLIISAGKVIKVIALALWNPNDASGSMTVQLQKNGTNVGTTVFTDNGDASIGTQDIDIDEGDNLVAVITAISGVTKAFSIEIKYSYEL